MVSKRVVLMGFVVSAAAVAGVLASGPRARVTEEVLGEISAGIDPEDVLPVVSDDGQKVAWEERDGKRSTVRLNGDVHGGPHDEVAAIRFSPDGNRFAHAARVGKAWRFIVDGVASAPFQMVSGLQFSQDGRRVAFSAKKDGKWVVVLDGVAGHAYDEIGAPIFSPDGERVIYPAKRRKKWVVVENHEERGPEMSEIWRGEYWLGGQILGNVFGKVRLNATRVTGVWARFAPDGQRYAYFARLKDGTWTPAVSGAEQRPGFDIVDWPVFFGAQFERVAYVGARVSKPFGGGEKATGHVVIDGVSGPPSEGEGTEKAASGMAKRFFGQPVKILQHGVLLNGVTASLHGVSGLVASPDREHLAYTSRRAADDYVIVRDGVAGPSFDRISCGPRFTAAGVMVYAGVSGDAVVLMADHVRRLEHAWKGADCTAPDRRHDGH